MTPIARRHTRLGRAVVVSGLVLALVALFMVLRPRLPGIGPEHWLPTAPEKWVSVSYAALVDENEIAQSGESIREVRGRLARDSSAYAQLQPFLEPFGRLLPDALDMVRAPTGPPSRSIADAFAPGGVRPAWAELLGGGRFVVTYDGSDRVIVFAPGRHAKAAYEAAYGVLRHPLAMVQACAAQPIRVQVFAYENDYAASELRLNLNAHAFTAGSFGPPHGAVPVDLAALDAFFRAENELLGARLVPDEGLVLVGAPGAPAKLAGRPIGVADLAVAYRAVFHAGHNQAFVSLDPSPDPRNVRVNFGGALQDTRLGQVVLQSDMRFKTLASGLDPVSFADVRERTRQHLPSFMTVAERDLASELGGENRWEGTRFWFYPDAVQIESDLEGCTAYVERARFKADAERSRGDFATTSEFQDARTDRLSPSIRANIDDLNARYDDYAATFAELRELGAVARLMGICSWLRAARTEGVDLDALLAAELPAVSTPREKPRLLTVSVFAHTGFGQPSDRTVVGRTSVTRIEPMLDQPVGVVFPSPEDEVAFIAATSGGAAASRELRRPGALCREYVHTQHDLQAFAEQVADGIMNSTPRPTTPVDHALAASTARLEHVHGELARLGDLMATSAEMHNRHVDRYNDLIKQYNVVLDRHNALVELANEMKSRRARVALISGGIDLAPKAFKVTRVATSPEIERVRIAAPEPNPGGWRRSPRPSGETFEPTPRLEWRWMMPSKGDPTIAAADSGSDAFGNKFWADGSGGVGAWKQRIALSGGRTIERAYDAGTRELRIAEFKNGKPKSYLVAKRDPTERIVFARRDPAALHAISSGSPASR